MSRKGRELELLIYKLEEIVLPKNAKIKSPDFLPHALTGKRREVDVSIKYNVGTSQILIIIECRDRKTSNEDVTWIEQLKTKCEGLNANKVIAVSSKGFSNEAILLANIYGIETRVISEITGEELLKFNTGNQQLVILKTEVKAIKINEKIRSEKILNKQKVDNQEFFGHTHDKIFTIDFPDKDISLNVHAWFLIESGIKKCFPNFVIPNDGTKVRFKFPLKYDNIGYVLKLNHNGLDCQVFDIYIDIIIWKEVSKFDLIKRINYDNDLKRIMQTNEYTKEYNDKEYKVIQHLDFQNQQKYYENYLHEKDYQIEIKSKK